MAVESLLKSVGFFRELKHGGPNQPSLNESASKEPRPDEAKIVSYLRSGNLLVACPGVGQDALEKGKLSGPLHIYTDGKWAWPGDLAYYVTKYHVSLPEEFIQQMKANNWEVPHLNREVLATLKRERPL